MKHLWLIYDPLLVEFVYYEGVKDGPQHNRREFTFAEEGLVAKLSELVDWKRSSILHVVDLPSALSSEIDEFAKDTKVKIDYQESR